MGLWLYWSHAYACTALCLAWAKARQSVAYTSDCYSNLKMYRGVWPEVLRALQDPFRILKLLEQLKMPERSRLLICPVGQLRKNTQWTRSNNCTLSSQDLRQLTRDNVTTFLPYWFRLVMRVLYMGCSMNGTDDSSNLHVLYSLSSFKTNVLKHMQCALWPNQENRSRKKS